MHYVIFFLATLYMTVAANDRPYTCPDYYSPCECDINLLSGLSVECKQVPIADIQSVFKQSKANNMSSFRITISGKEKSPIPANLLGASRTESVFINCDDESSHQLVIDDNAFNSSRDVIEEFQIKDCDFVKQKNLRFLKGLESLAKLTFAISKNFNSFEGIPSQSKLKDISFSFCEGFENLADGPMIALPGLQTLALEWSQLNDATAEKLLKIFTGSSKNSLEHLSLRKSNIIKMAELRSQFPNLKRPSYPLWKPVNDRPLTCLDSYSPCQCKMSPLMELSVICDQIPLLDIEKVFYKSQAQDMDSIRIIVAEKEKSVIPSNFLGDSRTKRVSINCRPRSSYQLVIYNEYAFESSKDLIEEFTITRCDLKNQKNFKFMEEFDYLTKLNIQLSKNFNSFEGIPSHSGLHSISISFSEGFDNLADGPTLNLPGLRTLDLEMSSLNDVTAAKLVKIFTGSSKNSLQNLNLKKNRLSLSRISELMSLFPNLKQPTSSVTVKSQVKEKPLTCPNYYVPCSCKVRAYGLIVFCDEVPIADIQALFQKTQAKEIFSISIYLAENETSAIPANILGASRTKRLALYCYPKSPYQLVIDDNAFLSSTNLIEEFKIKYCDLKNQPNLGFMLDFKNLIQLKLDASDNFNSFEGLPSQSKLKSISISFSDGFENLADGPEIDLPGLQDLNLEMSSLNDVNVAKILKILTGSSKSSLINLNFKNNRLTRVPEQILSFTNLNLISLERNAISVIKTNSLDFTGELNFLHLDENDISSIEPNAFGFAFGVGKSKTPILFRTPSIIFMKENKLTRLDSYVFQPLLERTEGSFSIGIHENPIECDCHLAWLIVHNRNLLTAIEGGTCSNSTVLKYLNPEAFRDCPIFTCPTGFDGNFLNPISNSSYYTCSDGNSVLLECPRGHSFNLASQICG